MLKLWGIAWPDAMICRTTNEISTVTVVSIAPVTAEAAKKTTIKTTKCWRITRHVIIIVIALPIVIVPAPVVNYISATLMFWLLLKVYAPV